MLHGSGEAQAQPIGLAVFIRSHNGYANRQHWDFHAVRLVAGSYTVAGPSPAFVENVPVSRRVCEDLLL